MKFLGIDPGYARTGYGIVEDLPNSLRLVDYGVIETDPGLPFPARLDAVYGALSLLIYEQQPQAAGVELLFWGRNITTAINVAQARGVALLALHRAGLHVAEFTPAQVKEAVSGYGRADKVQVQGMVKTILGMAKIPRPDDAADALAVAICLANRYRMDKILLTDVERKEEIVNVIR